MKNQKGITLIALVITIIVLLILAGVAIAMLSGDNGILTQASDSKVKSAIGTGKEAVAMAINEAISEYYEDKYVNTEEAPDATKDSQAEYVDAKLADLYGDNGDNYKKDGYVITMSETTADTESTTDEDESVWTITVSYYEDNAVSTTLYSTATMNEQGELTTTEGQKWVDSAALKGE